MSLKTFSARKIMFFTRKISSCNKLHSYAFMCYLRRVNITFGPMLGHVMQNIKLQEIEKRGLL